MTTNTEAAQEKIAHVAANAKESVAKIIDDMEEAVSHATDKAVEHARYASERIGGKLKEAGDNIVKASE